MTYSPRGRCLVAALLVFSWAGVSASDAASIQPTGIGRHAVYSLAGTFDGTTVLEDDDFVDVLTLPPFDDAVDSSIATGDARATGEAALRTTLGATELRAVGSAAATGDSAGGIRGTGRADTLFRFEFTVDETTPFELVVDLAGEGTAPFVDVFFSQDAQGMRFERQEAGSERFVLRGLLDPGVFYSFSANAVAGAFSGDVGGPTSAAQASSFDLRLRLPEPGAPLGLGMGLLALCRASRRTR